MELLQIISIAFFIAVLFSLLGLGGAIIYTPLLYWSGLPLLAAIPMALLLNMITTASSAITYQRLRLIDFKIALPIILTSIPGAYVGSKLARIIDLQLLILLLSIIIIFAGIRILFFQIKSTSIISPDKRNLAGAIAGFFISTLSSLVGIGGGTFIMPLLFLFGLDTKKAVGTSAFIVTFISLSGFLSHMSQGGQNIDVNILIFAGLAAFAGAQAGSRLIFKKTSPRSIEIMFALVILLVGSKLLYGLF
ncbi:MAG: sulfite exporter TauE/SafE family protein [Candidatus Methanoperedens sp.]|nr:sulfite exporter TauE/SafE family protein [Candidatus Methanoperedens sp.]